MPAKKKSRTVARTASGKKNTVMAMVAYILFFVPLLTKDKNDPFVKFHVKQSLVLLIASIVVNVAESLLAQLPMLGWVASGLIGLIVSVFFLVLWVMGVMNALNGKMEELPVIGKYADQLKF